ncbi:putative hemoglobin and hemoglobin-haptoglobin-binding protein 1 precursor, partial [Haemophilus influenzae]
SQKSKR